MNRRELLQGLSIAPFGLLFAKTNSKPVIESVGWDSFNQEPTHVNFAYKNRFYENVRNCFWDIQDTYIYKHQRSPNQATIIELIRDEPFYGVTIIVAIKSLRLNILLQSNPNISKSVLVSFNEHGKLNNKYYLKLNVV